VGGDGVRVGGYEYVIALEDEDEDEDKNSFNLLNGT
jgi:hypothetical protein